MLLPNLLSRKMLRMKSMGSRQNQLAWVQIQALTLASDQTRRMLLCRDLAFLGCKDNTNTYSKVVSWGSVIIMCGQPQNNAWNIIYKCLLLLLTASSKHSGKRENERVRERWEGRKEGKRRQHHSGSWY